MSFVPMEIFAPDSMQMDAICVPRCPMRVDFSCSVTGLGSMGSGAAGAEGVEEGVAEGAVAAPPAAPPAALPFASASLHSAWHFSASSRSLASSCLLMLSTIFSQSTSSIVGSSPCVRKSLQSLMMSWRSSSAASVTLEEAEEEEEEEEEEDEEEEEEEEEGEKGK